VERVRKMLEQNTGVQIDKCKCNEVHRIEWDSGDGDEGQAWVQTKGQLKQVVDILRSKAGMRVKVQGYLVPRDKSMLTKWLNENALNLPRPFSEQSFLGVAPQDE
jgi:hypothetical protein